LRTECERNDLHIRIEFVHANIVLERKTRVGCWLEG
jgi:hypothetical protein